MRCAVRTALLAGVLAIASASSAFAAWQPEPATYGIGQTTYTISGSGGTPLNVRVYYPTDKSGAEAGGTFPVLLAQTPYGGVADDGASVLGAGGAALAGYNPYLVERGYITASMDVRGTGSSGGSFGLFDPVQGEDGAIAIRWAAKLPHSSGVVGLIGASYLGIDQFAAAADAGPNSPVKAIFPIISATEVYRDEASAGGIPSLEFNLPYLAALVPGVSILNEVTGPPQDLLTALSGELQGLTSESVPLMTNIIGGGSEAFDGPYWQVRSPDDYIRQIVADKIPAFLIGGWYDLFQRGEPLNYSAFQNAFRNRSILAPMLRKQKITGRYQLIMAPTYHVTTGDLEYRGLNISELELAWFDHWLKGTDTGINDTSTPLHVYDLGTDSYREASTYPFGQATPTTYYFHGGGGLSTAPPTANTGSDQIVFTDTSIPCSTSIEQWGAGLGELLFNDLGSTDPCTNDANLSEQGPGAVSYTTAPFTKATTLAGPIGATIYANANTKDTLWVVSIADVAPNGDAHQLTQGVLDGSLRAVDQANTWPGSNGRPILPYHYYTQASQRAVVPGQVTRYDIEVFPTFDTLEPGHRLRVTVNTDDFPHVFPDAPQFTNMIGGVWQVQRNASAASGVELPLTTPSAFGTPAEPLYCGRASGRMAGRTLGPVKLGQTRATVRTEFLHEAIRGRWHNWEFLCLQGQWIEAWYPSPTFLSRLHGSERRAIRGRVALLLTANRDYTLDGARAGSRIAAVARRLHLKGPFKVGRISWYYVPEGRSVGVLKVRGGRVEDVGIALKQLISFGPRFWPYVTKRS